MWEPISDTCRLDTTLCCCQSAAYLPELVAWAWQLHTNSNYDCICISENRVECPSLVVEEERFL